MSVFGMGARLLSLFVHSPRPPSLPPSLPPALPPALPQRLSLRERNKEDFLRARAFILRVKGRFGARKEDEYRLFLKVLQTFVEQEVRREGGRGGWAAFISFLSVIEYSLPPSLLQKQGYDWTASSRVVPFEVLQLSHPLLTYPSSLPPSLPPSFPPSETRIRLDSLLPQCPLTSAAAFPRPPRSTARVLLLPPYVLAGKPLLPSLPPSLPPPPLHF